MTISQWFKDRVVQYPGRVRMINPSTLEESTVDLARAEGTITTEGTPFSADRFNRIADEMLDIGYRNSKLLANMLANSQAVNSTYFNTDINFGIKYDIVDSLFVVAVDVAIISTFSGYSRVVSSGSLPSSMRPSSTKYGYLRDADGDAALDYSKPYIQVNTSGSVSLYTNGATIPADTTISGEITWWG